MEEDAAAEENRATWGQGDAPPPKAEPAGAGPAGAVTVRAPYPQGTKHLPMNKAKAKVAQTREAKWRDVPQYLASRKGCRLHPPARSPPAICSRWRDAGAEHSARKPTSDG